MENINKNETEGARMFLNAILGENGVPKTSAQIEEMERLEYEEKERAKQSRFEKSGVGEKFFTKRLSDYKVVSEQSGKNLETVKSFIADVQNGINRTLWMCGKNGNGKTMLASMIVRECGGHYCKSYQIDDDFRDAMSFSAKENRKQILKRYAQYSLLVIDEVARFQNQSEVENLFRILNERYEADLPTILVTNLSREDLKKYLGLALYDRFLESCTSLEFNDASYRINERK